MYIQYDMVIDLKAGNPTSFSFTYQAQPSFLRLFHFSQTQKSKRTEKEDLLTARYSSLIGQLQH
jgi:hypothetical protein